MPSLIRDACMGHCTHLSGMVVAMGYRKRPKDMPCGVVSMVALGGWELGERSEGLVGWDHVHLTAMLAPGLEV